MLRVDGEVVHAGAIKNCEKQQQANQAGNDAGKAHTVELPQTDLMEAAPSLERPGGDQKAGDHKKNTNTVITAPKEDAVGCGTDKIAETAVTKVDSEIDVMENDGDDAEPTEKVDTGNAAVLCGDTLRTGTHIGSLNGSAHSRQRGEWAEAVRVNSLSVHCATRCERCARC